VPYDQTGVRVARISVIVPWSTLVVAGLQDELGANGIGMDGILCPVSIRSSVGPS